MDIGRTLLGRSGDLFSNTGNTLARSKRIANKNPSMNKVCKFIDLFSGMGGTRVGFEQACKESHLEPECVFSSDLKEHAIAAYKHNFGEDEEVCGDITKIDPTDIPEFDYLLAGFPCQPFSSAGKRKGFLDKRGGLFFAIVNILKSKNRKGFLLENVEGLASHNCGSTLKTIIEQLELLGYQVSWEILDASQFGVPQQRKRIYIVGRRGEKIDLNNFDETSSTVESIVERDAPFEHTKLTQLLSSKFRLDHLHGKAIKDKRGGSNNIHSWDWALKGAVSEEQRRLDAHYLIFEYAPSQSGIVIKRVWLKKVWEITCASERSAVKIQWKQNQAINIRPATWYSKSTSYHPFAARKDFVLALKKVLDTSPAGGDWRKNWFKGIEKKYQEQTDQSL